jgi:hypothetical protein
MLATFPRTYDKFVDDQVLHNGVEINLQHLEAGDLQEFSH